MTYATISPTAQGHNMSVELLTPDFLNSTLRNSGFIGNNFVEAPALFKRGHVYYAVFDHCCCL